jgi:diguanylate cyclase (GGDEF)-like protein/PAS domain S-box-containing protein
VRIGEEIRRARAPSELLLRVAIAANEAADTDTAFTAALAAVCDELGCAAGRTWVVDCTGELRPTGRWHFADASRGVALLAAADALGPGGPRTARWGPDEPPLGPLGIVATKAVPVTVGGEVVAVLEFFIEDDTIEVDGAEGLAQVAAQLSRVVERARAEQEAAAAARAEADRLAAIVQTQLDIATSGREMGHVLLLVVERAQELTSAMGATLELMEDGELVTRAATGIAVDWMCSRGPSTTVGGRCTETGQPVLCDDITATRLAGGDIALALASGSFVTAPILNRGRVVGLLRVVSSERRAFRARDVSSVRVLAGLAGAAMDRTAALTRLSESEERFRKAFDDAPIGMALVGLAAGQEPGTLLQVNRALAAMAGVGEAELLAGGLLPVVHPEDVLAVRSVLRTVTADNEMPCRTERRFVRPDGQVVWVSLSASGVADADDKPLYAIVQVEDISQRKEAEAKLTEMALHDPLTGLPNRLLLLDRVQRALSRARRRQTQVALLFCDLDRFKVINDSLGHETGDALLVAMARRLERALRDQDTAARLGGDEFVIVCEDVGDEAEAVAVAQRLQEVLGEPCIVGENEVVLTSSIGIVMSTGYASPYALLRDADAAMYRAKESGRARVALFDQELAKAAIGRLKTENGLRRALEQGELRLHYQPIVALRTGDITGFEALLRWQDPERGLVAPDQFLDVAEETGLIVPIGAWVLEEACRQLAEWQRLVPGGGPWTVAVNLSGRQVARTGLANVVAGALRTSGIDPSRLCLELTESILIEATTSALAMLKSLKALGVGLAIDDFGTGYSSLSYLRRFPVDVVKVDRSFVDGLGVDGEDDAIVSAVVGLTQRLGLRAVAEGVETEQQAARLRELGCDLAQGYLFARPQPAEAILPLLAASVAAATA